MAIIETKTDPQTSAAPKKAPRQAAPSGKDEFAVIMSGGKQYVVSVGSQIKIEKLKGEHKEGDSLTFDKVLVVDNGSETTIGTPYINGAKVTGKLEKTGRDRKVEIIKYKQKSRYFVRRGHRQPFFLVKIESIR